MKAANTEDQAMVELAAQEAAAKIKAGTYYQEALLWYHEMYHHPISSRAFLLVLLGVMGAITLFGMIAFFSMLPLESHQPVVMPVRGTVGKFPHMRPLVTSVTEDPNPNIQRWFSQSFVEAWEGYDVNQLDWLRKRVRYLAEAGVFEQYRELYTTADSPVLKYERHTKRLIQVKDVELVDDAHAKVTFVAIEEGPTEDKKSVWQADIAFRYKEIEVDQITEEITPMQFQVTGYQVKQLG